jgi:glycosyltransferase involved in cell wall biosynthesis
MERHNSLIGIVIPAYNRAHMLLEAIESVLSQDWPAKKIIVVDDGSNDGTAELCRGYVERGEIDYVHKSNGGCASARNLGLDYVSDTADYVCFLDSDDRQLPEFLSRAAILLENNPQADFCYADSMIYEQESTRERLQRVAAAGNPDGFAIEHFLSNEAKSGSILYRARTVRRRRFREDLRYNEDSEFLQRVAIECVGVYCPEPASWVRWHSGSKSRSTLEINRAVLQSSRDIIVAYPEFHARYREAVDKRIRKLEQALLGSLVLAAQWVEAEALAKTWVERFFVAGRIATYYQLRVFARTLVRRFVTRVV